MRLLFLFPILTCALLAQASAGKEGKAALIRDMEQLRQLSDKIRKDCPSCLDLESPVHIFSHLPSTKSAIIAVEIDSVSRDNLTTANSLLRDAILLLGVTPETLDKHSKGLSPAALARLRANMLVDLLQARKQQGGAK